MSQSLVEVNSFENCGIKIKNVVLYLFINKYSYVLTVTEKRGTVGFPAGGIEKTDKTVFKAMEREYLEETGNKLPKLQDIRRFIYNGDTGIYTARTGEHVPTTLGPKSDGEIISIHFSKIPDIKEAINNKGSFKLRKCAKRSTPMIFNQLKI